MTEDLTFRPYDSADAPAVVALWNDAMGEQYPMREVLLRQQMDRNPNFRSEDAVTVWDGGRLVGLGLLQRKRGPAPAGEAPSERAWLAAMAVAPDRQRQGIGTRMYDWLVAHAGLPKAAIQPGGGIYWFFPGAPTELPAARPFLESLGFHFGRDVSDVRADISTFALPGKAARLVAGHGLTVRTAKPHEVDRLLDFLLAEFGQGWWYNAGQFFRAGGAPEDWLLMLRGDEIVGMAHLHHQGQAVIGAPRYWAFGPGDGGLGPIGIAASLRGKGLGLALLEYTLAALRERGVTSAIADWTTLLDFYAKTGMAPCKTYATGAS